MAATILALLLWTVSASPQGKQGLSDTASGSGSQWAELADDQLDVLGGDGVVVHVDFHNEKVGNYPATLESLPDKDGAPLYNLQWWVKDRSFFMTTRNVNKDEALALAGRISRQMEALAHDGWRTAYDFAPENPAHRLVRSRQQAVARASPNPR